MKHADVDVFSSFLKRLKGKYPSKIGKKVSLLPYLSDLHICQQMICQHANTKEIEGQKRKMV